MELQGERTIPASPARTWAALNDPDILKGCITGCESLERVGDDRMQALLAVKVGPVSARFKGNLQITDVVAPTSYTIQFDGQGGVAGFGKGSAQVSLSDAAGGQTLLKYSAKAQVGGKLAQIGSRLVDAAAAKIAEDFFQAFEARLREEAGVAAPAAEAPAAGGRDLRWLWWAGAAIVVAALIYRMLR
ncbi:MAG: carbon monoxide dehydrogenase subunit G [Burkholderiales bacterium]|nr:carbon monoxide dehydrogenase subunit G [Burkholderiales bacterium]MDE1929291.1 carbon monoxide dehydrogenase subunit G [Burkholderiales bacterium]MDE2161507.1 carbon monoxide dehydrogenase subunit G [Burkholderiales bacterium]MDE2505151.1 carbon monoxide dehydrogenase subunit G [Burkholderiales bacterium]